MSTKSAKVIQVIQTMTTVGAGTSSDPNRVILQFWSLEGELLAVNDPVSPDASPPPFPCPSP